MKTEDRFLVKLTPCLRLTALLFARSKEAQQIFEQRTGSTKGMTILSSIAQLAGAEAACAPRSSRSGKDNQGVTTTWRPHGKRRRKKSKVMPKKPKLKVSADEIAAKATRGEDVSAHFTNKLSVVKPIHRVNLDLTHGMLRQARAGQ